MKSPDMIRTYIIGGDRQVEEFLSEEPLIDLCKSPKMPALDDIDMLVFTGGEDVTPSLYGERNNKANWLNYHRDQVELNILLNTMHTHYHFGICRGLQLMAVANGLKLWQHVSGHNLSTTHEMIISKGKWKGDVIKGVTSVHHQAIKVTKETGDDFVLGYEQYSQCVEAEGENPVPTLVSKIVEAAWFEESRCFGVQGHPEYTRASDDYKQFVLYHLLEDPETGFYANCHRGTA